MFSHRNNIVLSWGSQILQDHPEWTVICSLRVFPVWCLEFCILENPSFVFRIFYLWASQSCVVLALCIKLSDPPPPQGIRSWDTLNDSVGIMECDWNSLPVRPRFCSGGFESTYFKYVSLSHLYLYGWIILCHLSEKVCTWIVLTVMVCTYLGLWPFLPGAVEHDIRIMSWRNNDAYRGWQSCVKVLKAKAMPGMSECTCWRRLVSL